MCGPSYVFLFDTIYDRVKRLTKRMTSRRGLLVGRVSRDFTARREWITVASARTTEADQSARGTYWNGSSAWRRDLRGSRSTRKMNAKLSRLVCADDRKSTRTNSLESPDIAVKLMSSLWVWYMEHSATLNCRLRIFSINYVYLEVSRTIVKFERVSTI